MQTEQEKSLFDTMGGEFDARLKRNTVTTRTSRSDGRELTVSNPLAIIEARFSYKVLDRLYFPSFVAIEREVDGRKVYIVFEVVGVSPTHYQLSGVDSSMPTLLRKEYLDTIKESWGKSQETWIDLAAIPTNYLASTETGQLEFSRTPYAPLPGSQAYLLSKNAVEQFLCVAGGEKIGRMQGFDLPFTVDMDSLIRFHCAFFGFSLDHAEPIVYRESGRVKIGKIGELVDRYFEGQGEGRRYTSSIEALAFDPDSLSVSWSPVQYVFRHQYEGKLLRFHARTGRSVTVTPGHSLFVLRDGRIRCLPSEQLQMGDLLVGSRSIPAPGRDLAKVDILDLCERSQVEGLSIVGVQNADYPDVGSSVRYWKRWYWRSKNYLPLSFKTRFDGAALEKIRIGYKNCLHPIARYLEIDEEMARLLGYYTAEGHVVIRPGESYVIQFTLHRTKDRRLARDIREIIRRNFGITVVTKRHGKHGMRLTFRHKILAYVFAELVGISASRKRVPEVILNSPRGVRDGFLQAWAAGDYLVTSSEGLMDDVLHLLMMNGTVGTVSEWEGTGLARIEGRTVNARPRYQMSVPSAEEIRDGTPRSRRGRAEPVFPVRALPAAAKTLVTKPSSITRFNPRLSGRILADMVRRAKKLNSYVGAESLTVEGARHDGVYRLGFRRHLTASGGVVGATQLLVDATQQLEHAVELESDLTFYEIDQIEEVDPSSPFVYDVSVPHLENFMAGFGGVFCHNTGSGKSNLASSLIRLAMARDPDLKVVVMDIAGEYGVNLLDLLKSDARMISTEWFDSEEEFATSQAVPESLEEVTGRKAVEQGLSKVYGRGIDRLSLQEGGGLDLAWIQQLLENAVDSGKPGGTAAKMALGTLTTEFFEKRRLKSSTRLSDLDQQAAAQLASLLTDVHANVHSMSALVKDIDLIVRQLETGNFGVTEAAKLSPEKLAEQLAKGTSPRLNVIYAPEPMDARQAVQRLIGRLLFLKKKFGNKQRVLIVLDEAQEYIPDEHTPKDWTTQSNRAVEQLLRQGRKYRLHCWMATQRVARLNVNALQQLHSYFVSTLPRMYDRMVIADAFALPYEVLERSADLETGEWLFVSFKAAKQRNVPVFLKTGNNEATVAKSLA